MLNTKFNIMFKLNYTLISCLLTTFLLVFSVSAQVEVKEYYENGNIQIIGNLNENNLKTDKWEYFYENGQLEFEEEYVNGVLNGEFKSYYENGGVKVTGHYENDKRTGQWSQHYKNGQVGETGTFVEGVFKGEGRFYYENGKLMKVFYSDSDKTIHYDKKGNLVKAKKKKKSKKS